MRLTGRSCAEAIPRAEIWLCMVQRCAQAVLVTGLGGSSPDGLALSREFLNGDAFASLSGRIDKTLPQSSIFGMMFETQRGLRYLESTEFSLLQHNPFSWVVSGCDFVYERLSAGARCIIDGSIRGDAACSVTWRARERFVERCSPCFEATGAERFADIAGNMRENL